MINKETCHFCTSRCGMLLNMKNGLPYKLAKAPCEIACPAGIDIPRYIRLIADNRPGEAVLVIRDRVPFPGVLGHVCPQPCTSNCSRASLDEAVAIRALKRFAVEHDSGSWREKLKVSSPTGRRVAVVGSGACGLTAAYYLARLGHEVMVFEASGEAGGHMRTDFGERRLPREVLDREIDEIKGIGVKISTRNRIESVTGLLTQDFDAVLVGTGAPQRYKKRKESLPNRFDLWTGEKGQLIVDPDKLTTSTEGVFAAGEVVTGPALIVKAIADGRKAAMSIDCYLSGPGEIDEKLLPDTTRMRAGSIGKVKGHASRPPTSNHGLSETEAIEEARRCLWCDLVAGDPDHPLSKGWTCRRGRAHTARRLYELGVS